MRERLPMSQQAGLLPHCGRSMALRLLACALAVCAAIGTLGLTGCSSAEVERQKQADKADFHYNLANGYFHHKEVDLAIRELIRALEIDDMHADSRYLYGFILFGRKRFEDAAEHMRKTLQSRPKFFAARNHLGVTYLELDRPYDAIVVLEPLLNEPTYTTPYLVYNNLGLAYMKQGDLRKADEYLRMAVSLNPKFCNAFRNLGLVGLQQRDPRSAIENLTEACRLCPEVAEFHLQRGEALVQDGKPDAANTAFQRCCILAGETTLGRRCKARLGQDVAGCGPTEGTP